MSYIETYKKLNQLKDKYLALTPEQREGFDGKVLHSEIRNLGNKLRKLENKHS